MKKFTADHEWIAQTSEGIVTIGITRHAQEQLGDIVFVELPQTGRVVKQGEAIAVVESTKAASDVYAPLSGEIVAVNHAIVSDPSLINTQSESEGWFIQLRPGIPSEQDTLLDESAYKALIG
jgi:glycine cleavage system H protein